MRRLQALVPQHEASTCSPLLLQLSGLQRSPSHSLRSPLLLLLSIMLRLSASSCPSARRLRRVSQLCLSAPLCLSPRRLCRFSRMCLSAPLCLSARRLPRQRLRWLPRRLCHTNLKCSVWSSLHLRVVSSAPALHPASSRLPRLCAPSRLSPRRGRAMPGLCSCPRPLAQSLDLLLTAVLLSS
jgi:hypothetical protein